MDHRSLDLHEAFQLALDLKTHFQSCSRQHVMSEYNQ